MISLKKFFIFSIFLVILFTGCKKENTSLEIITKVEQENYYSYVMYPKFHNRKVDREIENYVSNLVTTFQKKNQGNITLLPNEFHLDFNMVQKESNILVEFTSTVYQNSYDPIISKKKFTFPLLLEKEEEKYFSTSKKIIDPKKPVVAFTFDDGPSKYTKDIMNLFESYDGNATFFIVGEKVENYKNLLKKQVAIGNELGNHTYSHKWLNRLSEEEIRFQIEETQNKIFQTTGVFPKHFRPGYGAINKKIRSCTDLSITFWNIDSNDWKIKKEEDLVKRVLKYSENMDGKIILMHDIHKRTFNALKKILPILKEKGYQFVTVSELEEVKLVREKLYEN